MRSLFWMGLAMERRSRMWCSSFGMFCWFWDGLSMMMWILASLTLASKRLSSRLFCCSLINDVIFIISDQKYFNQLNTLYFIRLILFALSFQTNPTKINLKSASLVIFWKLRMARKLTWNVEDLESLQLTIIKWRSLFLMRFWFETKDFIFKVFLIFFLPSATLYQNEENMTPSFIKPLNLDEISINYSIYKF